MYEYSNDVGSWLGDAVDSVASVAKKTVHTVASSSVLKATAVGVAFVMPPAGAAMGAGIAAATAADKLIAAGQGKKGKAAQKVAVKTMAVTVRAAARGDADAQRGLKALQVAKASRASASSALRRSPQAAASAAASAAAHKAMASAGKSVGGLLVTANGRVVRGNFRAV